MNQRYEFVKVPAGEPFPFKTDIYRWTDTPVGGMISRQSMYKDERWNVDRYFLMPAADLYTEQEVRDAIRMSRQNTLGEKWGETTVDFDSTPDEIIAHLKSSRP